MDADKANAANDAVTTATSNDTPPPSAMPMIHLEFSEPDIYGQSHPMETPQLIESRLQELQEELKQVEKTAKSAAAWQQAQQECPQLLGRDFQLLFLRACKFNTANAAQRIIQYWHHRWEIFGPERAFLPLTLDGALRDDAVALQRGILTLLPTRDPMGRALLLMDPSKQDRTLYTRESMARAVWYVLHAALQEDETVQQKGVVFLIFTKHVQMGQSDGGLARIVAPTLSKSLPLRLVGVHVCYPPTFFALVFPLVSFLLGAKLRRRVRLHCHPETTLLEFGLTRDLRPVVLGGTVNVDCEGWLEQRRRDGK